MGDSNPLGFAIRRENLCSSSMGEVDCGPTWGNFRACCPSGAYCPSTRDPGYYNAECCIEPNVNCTSTIIEEGPFCADTSWNMYDNLGFFCCEEGLQGFTLGSASVGCANESTYELSSNQAWLTTTVRQASKPTPTPSSSSGSSAPSTSSTSSSASAESAATSSSAPSSSSGGGISGGAIAGIVIGCLAAVAIAFLAGWFLLRRRRANKANLGSAPQGGYSDAPPEKGGQDMATENTPALSDQDNKVVPDPAEYPPDKKPDNEPDPVELPAESKPSEVFGSTVHPTTFGAEKPG